MDGGHRHSASSCAVALALGLSLIASREVSAGTFINIVDSALILAPTPTDYAKDYVEATGASGLSVKVKNTGSSGLTLLVRMAAPSAIAAGDLLVRTLTPPGLGGTTLSAYTAIGSTYLTLWASGVPQGPFVAVDMDVRVRNLFNYDDSATAGTTGYTNTLIFTVVEP
jgi:hypothetical protein